MSSARQYVYILFFGLILIASFFAIFKLIRQNQSYSPSIPKSTPNPQETQIIDWAEVEPLMSECQIKSIFQKRDLTVTLRSKNNQIYQTTQPKTGDILQLAKKYQGPCDIIQTISE